MLVDHLKIAIISTVINFDLYHKTAQLFPKGINRYVIDGRNGIHGLNHKELMLEDYIPNYYDKNIISIHFYHNLIFIYKGKNNDKSNVIINGKRKF